MENLTNPLMAYYYCSYCLELPVEIVDFWVEGFPLLLQHDYQVGYVILYDIDLEVGEGNIFRDCVDNLR